jgi:hypothetical protein
MELLKDFDFTMQYHPRKANLVVDALSCKPREVVAWLMVQEWKMLETLAEFGIRERSTGVVFLGSLMLEPTLTGQNLAGSGR